MAAPCLLAVVVLHRPLIDADPLDDKGAVPAGIVVPQYLDGSLVREGVVDAQVLLDGFVDGRGVALRGGVDPLFQGIGPRPVRGEAHDVVFLGAVHDSPARSGESCGSVAMVTPYVPRMTFPATPYRGQLAGRIRAPFIH